jgi:hypothetical protein
LENGNFAYLFDSGYFTSFCLSFHALWFSSRYGFDSMPVDGIFVILKDIHPHISKNARHFSRLRAGCGAPAFISG